MNAIQPTRERLWQETFHRQPCEVPAEPIDWLDKGAAAFVEAVFASLADGEGDKNLVEDLARVVNALNTQDHPLRVPMEQGLTALIQACLEPKDTHMANDVTRSRLEGTIRGARSILLRVKNGGSSPWRFPKWVQDRLLHHALEAVWSDVIAYTSGTPPMAKELSLMLAANYAAFRDPEKKARFIDLLKQLCNRSEDYMDPFLRDLVFIAQRVTRPEEVYEVVRFLGSGEKGEGRR
jgi:hypothetical protein